MQKTISVIFLATIIAWGALYPFSSAVATHEPEIRIPVVTTISAVDITSSETTLNASINPNGTGALAWFDWGISTSFGNGSAVENIASWTEPIRFTAKLSHLEPGTTYYFRVVAQNAHATVQGNILSFATPGTPGLNPSPPIIVPSPPIIPVPPLPLPTGTRPSISTLGATSVFQRSALIRGSVNPNGSVSTAWFEWRSTTSTENVTNSQPVGAGTIPANFSFILTGLSPNTIYYYRAVAQNPFGITRGPTISFTTQSLVVISPPTQPTPPPAPVSKVKPAPKPKPADKPEPKTTPTTTEETKATSTSGFLALLFGSTGLSNVLIWFVIILLLIVFVVAVYYIYKAVFAGRKE